MSAEFRFETSEQDTYIPRWFLKESFLARGCESMSTADVSRLIILKQTKSAQGLPRDCTDIKKVRVVTGDYKPRHDAFGEPDIWHVERTIGLPENEMWTIITIGTTTEGNGIYFDRSIDGKLFSHYLENGEKTNRPVSDDDLNRLADDILYNLRQIKGNPLLSEPAF